jgi:hypothetical protein
MGFLGGKNLLLVKIEGTKGTDSTPAAATEAIITKGDPKFEVVANPKAREIPMAVFGKHAPVNVGEALKVSFTTELKGSGTAGTASRYAPLFRSCNLTESISAGVSVTYTPNSTIDAESCTIYFYQDGTLHKMLGCVGTFKLNLKAGEIATVDWEFTGMYAAAHASDVSFPSATHEAIAPIIWKAANFVYNSVSTLIVETLNIDMGNEISKRLDGNAATGILSYAITQRNTKGSFNPEKVALATLNPWNIFNATTIATLETKPTGSAGNTLEITCAGVVLDAPKYAPRENVSAWDLGFSCHPSLTAGNAEMIIVFK